VDFRRILAFLALSMALMIAANWLFPPPKQPPKADQAADPAAEQADEQAAAAAGDEQPVGVEVPAAPPVDDASQAPRQFVAIGSLDEQSGYRMLVTTTNQGGAVHRAELASPRFRDLNDRSGYLGNLELDQTAEGLKVRVVGEGTPAAAAGIQVGDVIVGVGAEEAKDADEAGKALSIDAYRESLAKTRPGRMVTVRISRDGGQAQPIEVKLARRPLDVMRPEIENIEMRHGDVPDGFVDPPSFLLTLASWGDKRLDDAAAKQMSKFLELGNWEVTSSDDSSVSFERTLPGHNLRIVKRYKLDPVPPASRENVNYPGYDLRLEVEIHNLADQAQTLAYQLDGPTGLPMEGWWYAHKISQSWSAAGLRDVAVRFQGSGMTLWGCPKIAEDKVEPMGQGKSLAYTGVDGLYFSTVMIPGKKSLDEVWFDTVEAIRVGPKLDAKTPTTYQNVTCRLTRNSVEIPPGDALRDSFDVFVGPKRPELLAEYQAAGDPHYSLRDLVYYGWFGAVASVMLGILHFFYSIVGNYGIAIVMLTVLVRGLLFPISFKQTKNMARMQSLKPEMDRITEKYKGDMQKRSQAINELYRKHNINPLGGCLPMFLQLPILVGLWRSIMVDVELRQTPLFGNLTHWCSDLSAPDMLFNWSAFMPDFVNNGIGFLGLGPYFNILPLVTVALFLVSMKISMPPPTNEQAAMQQKIMKYMTLVMAVFFYKVASGLCLYLIVSSIWGIGERKLLGTLKQAEDTPALPSTLSTKPARDASAGTSRSAGGRNGSPGGKKSRKAKRRR
jgi:YidC/Oxa1 family membrane protein insertase